MNKMETNAKQLLKFFVDGLLVRLPTVQQSIHDLEIEARQARSFPRDAMNLIQKAHQEANNLYGFIHEMADLKNGTKNNFDSSDVWRNLDDDQFLNSFLFALRQPVGSISGFVELAQSEVDNLGQDLDDLGTVFAKTHEVIADLVSFYLNAHDKIKALYE